MIQIVPHTRRPRIFFAGPGQAINLCEVRQPVRQTGSDAIVSLTVTLRSLINARRLFSAHLFIYNATLIKSHFYIATLKKIEISDYAPCCFRVWLNWLSCPAQSHLQSASLLTPQFWQAQKPLWACHMQASPAELPLTPYHSLGPRSKRNEQAQIFWQLLFCQWSR